jgi:hypothetical protein
MLIHLVLVLIHDALVMEGFIYLKHNYYSKADYFHMH